MKQLGWVVILMFLAACGGESAPLTVSCKPVANVTVPGMKGKPAKAKRHGREVVHVYWDASKSMRTFAVKPVVAALDSALLSAHASAVEQFGVGETIVVLPNAQAALKPTSNRTALHLVAERIGMALASGDAQAALVISDMELDTPPRVSASKATVCGNVPLPNTPEAGALFGRCFENAVLDSDALITRKNLIVHVFRKATKDRELFILLFATDRAFGRRISDEVARRLDFSRHVIFDSGAVAAANLKGCRMTMLEPEVRPRNLPACGVKCFDPNATLQAECDLGRSADDAWVYPSGFGVGGVKYESVKKKAGEKEEQAFVRFAIPCNAPPGRINGAVSFRWQERTAAHAEFATKASVRDLFGSLTDAIRRTALSRQMNIGIDLSK